MALVLSFVFFVAAVIGSFLNVCIFRIPARKSVITPRSFCPVCLTQIRARDNVPILSYILLLGRCRSCGTFISPRYPLVEALTGAAGLAAFVHYGLTVTSLVVFVFLCILIVVSFIDIDHQIIPDVISLPGIIVGFLAALLPGGIGWKDSLLGILLGGGILWAIAELYYRLTGREGMGGGDIKLLAMIGAFLGCVGVPVTLMLASLVGSVIGLTLILIRGRDSRIPMPFGPFLAGGAACAAFFGKALIEWYLDLTAYPFF